MSNKMKTLEDLFEHQLKDLYSAESQLIDAMPGMMENAENSTLKRAIKDHLAETQTQRLRVQEACEKVGIDPKGEKCNAIEGLIAEAEEFMNEADDPEVMDAGIIANAQRIEHYEIAGYGTAHQYAQRLGHHEVAKLLKETLDEEKHADSSLNELAVEKINEKAEA